MGLIDFCLQPRPLSQDEAEARAAVVSELGKALAVIDAFAAKKAKRDADRAAFFKISDLAKGALLCAKPLPPSAATLTAYSVPQPLYVYAQADRLYDLLKELRRSEADLRRSAAEDGDFHGEAGQSSLLPIEFRKAIRGSRGYAKLKVHASFTLDK